MRYLPTSVTRRYAHWDILSTRQARIFGRKADLDVTDTAGGTTGNQVIISRHSRSIIERGGSSIVVTNSFIVGTSYVLCTVQTNDATAILKNATPAAGSVTIRTSAAVTGETRIACIVVN